MAQRPPEITQGPILRRQDGGFYGYGLDGVTWTRNNCNAGSAFIMGPGAVACYPNGGTAQWYIGCNGNQLSGLPGATPLPSSCGSGSFCVVNSWAQRQGDALVGWATCKTDTRPTTLYWYSPANIPVTTQTSIARQTSVVLSTSLVVQSSRTQASVTGTQASETRSPPPGVSNSGQVASTALNTAFAGGSSSTNTSGLSQGSKIAIGIAVPLGVIAVGALVALALMYRRYHKREPPAAHTPRHFSTARSDDWSETKPELGGTGVQPQGNQYQPSQFQPNNYQDNQYHGNHAELGGEGRTGLPELPGQWPQNNWGQAPNAGHAELAGYSSQNNWPRAS